MKIWFKALLSTAQIKRRTRSYFFCFYFQGGTLICSEDVPENIWKNVESNLKSQSKFGLKTDFRSPVILKHLLELVSHDKVNYLGLPWFQIHKKCCWRRIQTFRIQRWFQHRVSIKFQPNQFIQSWVNWGQTTERFFLSLFREVIISILGLTSLLVFLS
jgi:hypothetical protein